MENDYWMAAILSQAQYDKKTHGQKENKSKKTTKWTWLTEATLIDQLTYAGIILCMCPASLIG